MLSSKEMFFADARMKTQACWRREASPLGRKSIFPDAAAAE